jgi:hypothetical protein
LMPARLRRAPASMRCTSSGSSVGK